MPSISESVYAQVMDKHYILREPEDDVVLAEELIRKVLGKTVPFPEEEDVTRYFAGGSSWAKRLGVLLAGGSDEEGGEEPGEGQYVDDDDGELLEWWAFAEVFGVPHPKEAQVAPLTDLGSACDVLVELPRQVQQQQRGAPVSEGGGDRDEVDVSHAQQPVRAHHQGEPADAATPKKFAPISEDKKQLYAEFSYDHGPSGHRMPVSDEAHMWMWDQLQAWQVANGKQPNELPYANEWYYDKRVEGIKAGLLDRGHSQAVVKSYLRHKVKTAQAVAGE